MKFFLSVGYKVCVASLLLAAGCNHPHQSTPTIRIRWAHDPEMLNPMALRNQPAFDAYNLLNISLLQADIQKQELAPALAEALPTVQVVNDSMTGIGYRIRSAAAWDNGQPVIATDVAFTLKLMFCPGLPNEAVQRRYGFIQAVRPAATDPRRFTFLCRGRSIESAQTTGDFFILPETSLDPRGQLRRFSLADFQHQRPGIATDSGVQEVVRRYRAAIASQTAPLPGCGAYQLVKWEKDQYLRFQRKPHWWADQVRPAPFALQALPPRIDFLIIPDVATATLALRRGDLDVYPQVPARVFAHLRASPAASKLLRYTTTDSYDVAIAGFNTRHPVLADALTRRALSQCFDAPGLLRATQLGQGQRTIGLINPTDHLNYNDSLALVPYAPAGALALLRRAGWHQSPANLAGEPAAWFRTDARGQRQQLLLRLRYRASDEMFATIALQFQAAAASINIPVQLLPTESGAFSNALQTGDFDVYVRVMKGNPFLFNFTPFLHTAGIGTDNSTGFSTPASDRLIEAIAAAESTLRRARLLRRFQAMMQDQAPFVPLFFLPTRIAASRKLAGLHPNSLKPGYSATTLEWISPPSPAP